jgi:type I restriction enzyme S subunit
VKDVADFGWAAKPLGDLVDVLDRLRKPITKKDRKAGPYPYYGATGVLDHVDGYLFDEPLVLIGEDGAKWEAGANSAFAIEGKTWVNNHAHVIRPLRDNVLDDWLIYYLNGADLMPFISGMTVPKLNQGRLREIPIPLPPLEEQQRIVAVLDEAFEGLACARKNAEVNLQNARELFERQLAEYFLETPDDWIFRKLKQITSKIGSGATPKGGAGAYKTQGISLIRSLNIHDRWFKEDKLAFIDDQQADKLSNVVVDERDVLLNITGASIARCCVAPSKFLPARVNQHVSIIRPDRDILSPEFLALMLTSQPYKDRLLKTGEGNGSTRQALTKALIQSLEVAFPPEVAQQEEAVSVLETAEKKSKELTVAYQAKLQDVEDLRQSLLQKAFAGELT